MSYSREDIDLQRRIVAELRGRGINIWVDLENLIPGSPAWEREIERSIRGAAGLIVLLSPASNNSEWVRREVSFAEQNEKRIFPVLVSGAEDDSIPLRLSNHQHVDLRRHFDTGIDELANALQDHLGTTKVIKRKRSEPKPPIQIDPANLRKFALPGLIALIGLACIGGAALGARSLYRVITNLPTATVTLPPDIDPTTTVSPVATDTAIVINTNLGEPTGKIVYTCQVRGEEICIINADGSDWRQLTDLPSGSNYGSLSPDGVSVVFVGRQTGYAEVYEVRLDTGTIKQLTQLKGDVGAPEISPDNKLIAFTYRPTNRVAQLWIMNRDGSDLHEFYSSPTQDSHDPTWSPDGTQILFAMGRGENNKLYIIGISDGRDPQVINDSVDTRGRSDWSLQNLLSFDMGGPLKHDVFTMNVDGSDLKKFTNGNNSQGASFSPDGKWIAFTAYAHLANNDLNSCEIYIMRVDGTDLRRLTENNYCDFQPRWGN
jgi:Tol biopolymer transport system component